MASREMKRNKALIEKAHSRLDELLEKASDTDLYGMVGIRVKFEFGVAQLLEHTFEGKDK